MSDSDRRLAPRVSYRAPARLTVGDDVQVGCEALDLSARGISLLAPQSLVPGEVVRVAFGGVNPISVPSRVTRAIGASEDNAYGLQFLWMPTQVRAVIRDYVARRLKGEHEPEVLFPHPRPDALAEQAAGPDDHGDELETASGQRKSDSWQHRIVGLGPLWRVGYTGTARRAPAPAGTKPDGNR